MILDSFIVLYNLNSKNFNLYIGAKSRQVKKRKKKLYFLKFKIFIESEDFSAKIIWKILKLQQELVEKATESEL